MNEARNRGRGLGMRVCACGRALWRQTDSVCSICEARRPAGMRIVESRLCRGCEQPSGELEYCARCTEEIAALNRMYALEERKRAEREQPGADRVYSRLMSLRHLLWVPELIFVGCALLYLGFVFGHAVIEWITQGGVQ